VTLSQIQASVGIKTVRKVSDTTVVVDYANGTCRPATELETRMWSLLLSLKEG
jgi:hypothetical protein